MALKSSRYAGVSGSFTSKCSHNTAQVHAVAADAVGVCPHNALHLALSLVRRSSNVVPRGSIGFFGSLPSLLP